MTETKTVVAPSLGRTKLFPPVSKEGAPVDDDFDDMASEMERDMFQENGSVSGAQKQCDRLLYPKGKNTLIVPVHNIVRMHDGEFLEVPSEEVLVDCIKKAKRDSRWDKRVADMIEAKHVVVLQGLGSLRSQQQVNMQKTTDPIQGLVWYVRIAVKSGNPKSIDKDILTKIPSGTYKKLVEKFKADPNLQPDPERVGSSRNGSWLVYSVGDHKSLEATCDNCLKLYPTHEEHSQPWKKYTMSVDEVSCTVPRASVGEDRGGNCSVETLASESLGNESKRPLAIKKRKLPGDADTPSTGDVALETSKKICEATTKWLDNNTLALSEEVALATRERVASPLQDADHVSSEKPATETTSVPCAAFEKVIRVATIDSSRAPLFAYNSGTTSATHRVLLEEDPNGLFFPTLQCQIPMLLRGNSRVKVTVSVELE
jgi:hypothetical protein